MSEIPLQQVASEPAETPRVQVKFRVDTTEKKANESLQPAIRCSILTKSRARSLFYKYDEDKDDFLNKKEFQKLIAFRNGKVQAKEIYDEIFEIADLNDDEKISFEEFYKIYLERTNFFNKIVITYMDMFPPNDCCTFPYAMLLISVIQLVFYIIDDKTGNDQGHGMIREIFFFNPCARSEIWRLLSYMFVHSTKNLLHLVGNLVIQLVFASPLESYHSWGRLLIVYLSGVLAGSLGHNVFINERTDYLIGASAGVFALLTANIVYMILNWSHHDIREIGCIQCFVSFMLIIYQLVMAKFDNEIGRVSHNSHIFGGIAGMLIGIAVLKNLDKTKAERITGRITLALYLVLVIIGLYHFFYAPKMTELCEDRH